MGCPEEAEISTPKELSDTSLQTYSSPKCSSLVCPGLLYVDIKRNVSIRGAMETDRAKWLKGEVLASGREAAADTHLNETDMVGLMGCLPTDPCKCEHLQDGITVGDRASKYIAVDTSNLSQQDPGSYNTIEHKK